MNDRPFQFPRFIALRYVSVGKRSQLVSFMSAISIIGLAFGVAILITVLSVMNGFDKEMRDNILGIVPHISLSSEENLSSDDWQEIAAIINQYPMVESSAPVIETTGVVANAVSNKGVLVNGIDAQLEPSVSAIDRFIIAGSLANLQQVHWGLVMGDTLARRLDVGVGDRVDLFSTAVSVNPITPLATFRSFE
ncbi:MAG: ABC transporter permease, partial [Gammaproteobacteria bacterium]|nr:ABC transporter permease [Gammaproteobacteria bacterium]